MSKEEKYNNSERSQKESGQGDTDRSVKKPDSGNEK